MTSRLAGCSFLMVVCLTGSFFGFCLRTLSSDTLRKGARVTKTQNLLRCPLTNDACVRSLEVIVEILRLERGGRDWYIRKGAMLLISVWPVLIYIFPLVLCVKEIEYQEQLVSLFADWQQSRDVPAASNIAYFYGDCDWNQLELVTKRRLWAREHHF